MLAARAGPRPEEEEEASELGRRGRRFLMRSLGGIEQLQYRVLRARSEFDNRLQRKFPAFRGLHLREVLRTHAGGQRVVSALPEFCAEFVTHDAVLSRLSWPTKRSSGSRRRETAWRSPPRAAGGLRAPARTIPQRSGSSRAGFSCSEYRVAACQGQTMKSHPLHKKNSPVP